MASLSALIDDRQIDRWQIFLCACIIYRENNPISGIIIEFYFIAISLFVFECFVLWTYIHNLQMERCLLNETYSHSGNTSENCGNIWTPTGRWDDFGGVTSALFQSSSCRCVPCFPPFSWGYVWGRELRNCCCDFGAQPEHEIFLCP